ncbi:Not1-domain-containing protein [Neocallimastix lanati (nom. inval.)]|nr:Not1-domain-containing protein [Neocallimastix sp. JGI-2020a]
MLEILNKTTLNISISKFIKDLGYGCTSSENILENVLQQIGTELKSLKEKDVASLLLMMAQTNVGLKESSMLKSMIPSSYEQEYKTLNSWDVKLFIESLKKKNQSLVWNVVFKSFDQEGFQLYNQKEFEFLLEAFSYIYNDINDFPISILWEPWNNYLFQFEFIRFIILSQPNNLIKLLKQSKEKVITLDTFSSINGSAKLHDSAILESPWNSMELIRCLITLMVNDDIKEYVREFFGIGIKKVPEIILISLAQINIPKREKAVVSELLNDVLMILMDSHSNSAPVIQKVWKINPSLLISGLTSIYKKFPTSLSKILDIAQEVKGLSQILETKYYHFAIDLASLASRRDYLNLDKWLQDHIKSDGEPFLMACLEFLDEKITQKLYPEEKNLYPQSVLLSYDTVLIFIKVINYYISMLNNEQSLAYKKKLATYLQAYPQSKNINSVEMNEYINPLVSENDKQQTAYLAEIRMKANEYLELFYKNQLSVDQLMKLFINLKSSKNKYDLDLLNLMTANIVEGGKSYIHYPEILLIGNMIKCHILTDEYLVKALKLILDSLKAQPNTNLFNFGLSALIEFKSRLPEWPHYCSNLLQIGNLHQYHPEIIRYIQGITTNGMNYPLEDITAENPSNSFNNMATKDKSYINSVSIESTKKALFKSLNINPEIDFPIKSSQNMAIPSEAVQDKILFIINNVSVSNIDIKVQEFKEILKERHYHWLSQYLVEQRVSIEPNFHSLYISFLDKLEKPLLMKIIVYETFVNIYSLINSESIVNNSSERSLLKNLGTWLGGITLAKNKPIKHRVLAMKEILLEGYDNGRLIVIIPFVCKVLEQASKSIVFRPPNPWTMAILKVLSELYEFTDLKLNLKFEIEVLCKSLDIDIKDIKPSNYLKERQANNKIRKEQEEKLIKNGRIPSEYYDNQQLMNQQRVEMSMNNMNNMNSQVMYNPGTPSMVENVMGMNNNPMNQMNNDMSIYPELQLMTFNTNISLFNTYPLLKQFIQSEFNQAIDEVLIAEVERCVNIGVVTTGELILKDFIMEPSEEKMRSAAHITVQSLVTNLIMANCKDTLRININNHIRNLFISSGLNMDIQIEQIINSIISSNYDLAYSVIERLAIEKAIISIDKYLNMAYIYRINSNKNPNQTFIDMKLIKSMYTQVNIPDMLSVKIGGLTPAQYQIYKEFRGITPTINAMTSNQQNNEQLLHLYNQQNQLSMTSQQSLAMQLPQSQSKNQALSMMQMKDSSLFIPDTQNYNNFINPQTQEINYNILINLLLEKLIILMKRIENIINQYSDEVLYSIKDITDIHILLIQIPSIIISNNNNIDDIPLMLFEKIITSLYKSYTTLSQDIYTFILNILFKFLEDISTRITSWFLLIDSEVKLNVPVTKSILKSKLISTAEFDEKLSQQLNENKVEIIDYVANLINAAVFEDMELYVDFNEFPKCIETFHYMVQYDNCPESIKNLLNNIKKRNSEIQYKGEKTPSQVLKDSESSINKENETDENANDSNTNSATKLTDSSINKSASSLDENKEILTFLFKEWMTICLNNKSEEEQLDFITRIQNQGLFKSDNVTYFFFRYFTEISINQYIFFKKRNYIKNIVNQPVDAYAKLIVLLIKYKPKLIDNQVDINNMNNENDYSNEQVKLATQVLSVIVLVMVQSHEKQKLSFNQQPYFRLFSSILYELEKIEKNIQQIYFQILLSISNSFHSLQPLSVPGFTFSWLQLISHRSFMPKLILLENQKGWPYYLRHIIDLFKFLGIFLQTGQQLSEEILMLYSGTLRVFLVLLHDFPEFLSGYHIVLIDVIPSSCIQLRNLILSAFPSNMRFPDPLTPNLKIENLQDFQQPPIILSDYTANLIKYNIKQNVDQYLKNREPESLIINLNKILLKNKKDDNNLNESKYNIPLINSLIFYIGIQAINAMNQKPENTTTKDIVFDIYMQLMKFDSEGRYYILNAIVNQLRYPNSHTQYFSSLLLKLFIDAEEEIIQEQITRVLLERLVINKPHPWGLLFTFIELIKNQKYKFWEHKNFIKCAPEIEEIFNNVVLSVSRKS